MESKSADQPKIDSKPADNAKPAGTQPDKPSDGSNPTTASIKVEPKDGLAKMESAPSDQPKNEAKATDNAKPAGPQTDKPGDGAKPTTTAIIQQPTDLRQKASDVNDKANDPGVTNGSPTSPKTTSTETAEASPSTPPTTFGSTQTTKTGPQKLRTAVDPKVTVTSSQPDKSTLDTISNTTKPVTDTLPNTTPPVTDTLSGTTQPVIEIVDNTVKPVVGIVTPVLEPVVDVTSPVLPTVPGVTPPVTIPGSSGPGPVVNPPSGSGGTTPGAPGSELPAGTPPVTVPTDNAPPTIPTGPISNTPPTTPTGNTPPAPPIVRPETPVAGGVPTVTPGIPPASEQLDETSKRETATVVERSDTANDPTRNALTTGPVRDEADGSRTIAVESSSDAVAARAANLSESPIKAGGELPILTFVDVSIVDVLTVIEPLTPTAPHTSDGSPAVGEWLFTQPSTQIGGSALSLETSRQQAGQGGAPRTAARWTPAQIGPFGAIPTMASGVVEGLIDLLHDIVQALPQIPVPPPPFGTPSGPSPLPPSPLPSSSVSSSTTLTAGGQSSTVAGGKHGVLGFDAAHLFGGWQSLQRDSLEIPTGIDLARILPPG
jgi:hypothetical protein